SNQHGNRNPFQNLGKHSFLPYFILHRSTQPKRHHFCGCEALHSILGEACIVISRTPIQHPSGLSAVVGCHPSDNSVVCAGSLRKRWCMARLRSRSEEHTSELQSLAYLVCRLLLEKK